MTRKLKQVAAAALGALLGTLPAAPSLAANERDLTSTLSLLGLPCGKVVKAEEVGSNDHIATCQNGNRYRVTLNAKGKVVAKKL